VEEAAEEFLDRSGLGGDRVALVILTNRYMKDAPGPCYTGIRLSRAWKELVNPLKTFD